MKELLLKRKRAFTIYIMACFIPVISQIMSTYVFARLIGSVEEETMQAFYQALFIGFGFVILSSLLFIVSRFLRIRFMRDTILDVRLQAFDKIMKLDYETFSQKSKEVYVSNLINDVNLFEQHFFIKLLNIIFLGGTYSVAMLVLLFMDFKFGLGVFGLSVLVFGMSKFFESKTVALQEEVSNLNEKLTVDVANTINGMEILKLNQIEDSFLNKSLVAIDRVERKKMFFAVFGDGQRGFSMVMGTLGFVGILVYLLFQTQKGLGITQMVFMVQIANACVWPLQQIMPLINEFKASLKIYNKITSLENRDESVSEGTLDFDFNESIEVKHLSFSYETSPVLENVSFTIEKGKKYLVRGVSGSGKSTLMKILSKTFSRYMGQVKVDGISLKDIHPDAYNEKVSFVYQDVFLFEDTLLSNIALYKPSDDIKIQSAAKAAGLLDVIESHPDGIHQMVLENGKNLSGGQRQRVSIARAIFKGAEILFADEATSSLNHELGAQIEETLLKLDCTVFAISHRYYPGVTDGYDYVLEIKNGHLKQVPASEYFKGVQVA